MAIHHLPDKEGGDLTTFINDSKLRPWAEESIRLLDKIPSLRVWEVQYKGQGVANTCWYVGSNRQQKPYLLNFTMIPSNLNVEFRFSQYLPPEDFEQLKWQNSSWRYADIESYGRDSVRGMIERYLATILDDLLTGRLRQGGKSFAEELILRSIKEIYEGQEICENRRPDDLRSEKNTPLELDLYVPQSNIAIEVQGPQHFREVFGPNATLKKNDLRKKQWCRDKDIRLIWMNWEGFNKSLLRLSFQQRTQRLKEIINEFVISGNRFLWWKDVGDYLYE